MTIIIDSDNYGLHGIETMFFPGGEPHAKIPKTLSGDVLLFLKLRTWNDVGIAACVASALDHNNAVTKLRAFIPYFPGARQDRSDGLAPMTVEIMTHAFHSVIGDLHVFDPHSDAVNNWSAARAWMPRDLPMPNFADYAGVIAPDAGAVDRATSFRDRFCPGADLIRCTKQRDSTSGALSHYEMPTLDRVGRYLIVDDICDGGGTFNLLATAFGMLPIAKQSELSMFISHGIFSKGLEAIHPSIRFIITTDSWCQLPNSERLWKVPLRDLFPQIIGATP